MNDTLPDGTPVATTENLEIFIPPTTGIKELEPEHEREPLPQVAIPLDGLGAEEREALEAAFRLADATAETEASQQELDPRDEQEARTMEIVKAVAAHGIANVPTEDENVTVLTPVPEELATIAAVNGAEADAVAELTGDLIRVLSGDDALINEGAIQETEGVEAVGEEPRHEATPQNDQRIINGRTKRDGRGRSKKRNSAYWNFCKTTRSSIQQQFPGDSLQEINRRLGKAWFALTPAERIRWGHM